MGTNGKVNIRLYKKGDEILANDFHNREYGTSRTIDQWAWEFLSYDSDNPPFIIAEIDGKIVGTQALMPIVLIENGKTFLSAKSEETLVTPECRGMGILNRMYRPLYQWCTDNKAEVIWGFTFQSKVFKVMMKFAVPKNNEQYLLVLDPYPAYRLITDRYPDSPHARSSLKPIPKQALLRPAMHGMKIWGQIRRGICSKRLWDSKFRIEEVEAPDQRFDDLSTRFSLQYPGITIHRSSEYLEWRIFSNPDMEYKVLAAVSNEDDQMLGYAIGTIDRATNEGYIVDVMAAGSMVPNVVLCLLTHITNSLASDECISIRGWKVSQHPFDNILSKQYSKLGFFHAKRGASIIIRPTRKDDDALRYTNIDNWYMSRIFGQGISSSS